MRTREIERMNKKAEKLRELNLIADCVYFSILNKLEKRKPKFKL